MAFNIVTTIINMIAPSVLDRLAAALGINPSLARTALSAAVPAVLGAFGSKASTDTGARALFDAISKTDTSALGDLASTLTGASGEKFLKGGLGTLSSLLGDGALNGLTGAIAKQAGISSDASSSLVSLAGSLAMGQLAKSVTGEGLNASSLAGLLSSQQSNIASALPAGLGSLLSSAGVLGGNYAGQATRVATEAARTATAASHEAAQVAKKGVNWMTWLIPLVIALAALWYFLGNSSAPVKDAVAPAATSLVVDGVDLTKQVGSMFDGLKTTLGGITDAATAQSALPKLEEAVKSVDGLSAILPKLSAEQKTMLAGLITAALPTLKELVAKVLAIPGVGDVLKPTADALMGKIEALTKA